VGAKITERALKWAVDEGATEISFYGISMENLLKRPKRELEVLWELYEGYLNRVPEDEFVRGHDITFRVFGNTDLLPLNVRDAIQRAEAGTEKNGGPIVNLLMPYGGDEEILNAIRAAAMPPLGGPIALVNPKMVLEQSLWVKTPVDFVIRTGGEYRLSNFLPYQTIYAEYIFLNKYWPDFTREDLRRAFYEFRRRERRVGE